VNTDEPPALELHNIDLEKQNQAPVADTKYTLHRTYTNNMSGRGAAAPNQSMAQRMGAMNGDQDQAALVQAHKQQYKKTTINNLVSLAIMAGFFFYLIDEFKAIGALFPGPYYFVIAYQVLLAAGILLNGFFFLMVKTTKDVAVHASIQLLLSLATMVVIFWGIPTIATFNSDEFQLAFVANNYQEEAFYGACKYI
jgi:hypothetical protein